MVLSAQLRADPRLPVVSGEEDADRRGADPRSQHQRAVHTNQNVAGRRVTPDVGQQFRAAGRVESRIVEIDTFT